jgi:putative salt-induced outer membrane protein YdiY
MGIVPPSLPAAAHVAPPPTTPPPRWRAELDVGVVSTSGNSSVRTINAGELVGFAPGLWRFTQTFSLVYGYSDSMETANALKTGVRADYAVGTRFLLFALGSFTRDRHAGIARRFEEAAGLAYVLLAGPANVLDLEAGAGRSQQTATGGTLLQYWNARVALHYRLNFTSHASFEQKAEVLTDLENPKNLLVNTETSLVAPVSSTVGLKLGYVVRFANEPPSATVKKTDTVLSAGLQLHF